MIHQMMTMRKMKMRVKRRMNLLMSLLRKKKTRKTRFHCIKTYLPYLKPVSPVKFFFKTDHVFKWRMTISLCAMSVSICPKQNAGICFGVEILMIQSARSHAVFTPSEN